MFRNCGCNHCGETCTSECGGCGGGNPLCALFSGGNFCWLLLILVLYMSCN